MKTIESEKILERKLCDEVKKLGGHAFKFVSPNHRGVPDRICLLPFGIVFFVELKTTGKKMTKLQELCQAELTRYGQKCYIVDNSESLEKLIESYRRKLERLIQVSNE